MGFPVVSSPMDIDTADDGRLRLAQELLDSIIDHLHCDPVSLKRCALASKSLLPTCQRHLFSTFRITESNSTKLAEIFTPPRFIDQDEDATLRAVIAHLLNTHTTDLILTNHPKLVSGYAVWRAHLPEFKNVQKITFKGDKLDSAVTIPPFLQPTWMSPSSKIRSVEFDFRLATERGFLDSLYILPTAVDDVNFTCARAESSYSRMYAAKFREEVRRGLLRRGRPYEGVHQFNGALKLRFGPDFSYERLLSVMLELDDLFKFSFERINYRLTWGADICYLASLVGRCKNTLQYLDIMIPSPPPYLDDRHMEVQSFDFSHHRALRIIRIWTPGNFNPDWLCAAISSIPRPSSTAPRAPPLRIELHVSLPQWMMHPRSPRPSVPDEVDRLTTPWIAVDAQLSALIGFNPDAPSATSVTDGKTMGIVLDISIPELTTGPGKGIAALMFPLLSGIKGLIRLV